MASLYKRATPRQAMVLRMIEGAVHNAMHAHPGRPLDDRLARGIAKRAAGTLTSQWRAVLAAPQGRSEGDVGNWPNQLATGCGHVRLASGKGLPQSVNGASGPRHISSWRGPLRLLHKAIGQAAGRARKEGSTDRQEAFTDVLRLLAELIGADAPPPPGTRLKIKD